jgi:hypothetical protein
LHEPTVDPAPGEAPVLPVKPCVKCAKKTVFPKAAQDLDRVTHGAIAKGKAKLHVASAPPSPAPLYIENIESTLDATLVVVVLTSLVPFVSGSALPVQPVAGLVSALPASFAILPLIPTLPTVALLLLPLVGPIVFPAVSPASLADSSPSFTISHTLIDMLIDQVQTQHLAALWAKGLLHDTALLPASSAVSPFCAWFVGPFWMTNGCVGPCLTTYVYAPVLLVLF